MTRLFKFFSVITVAVIAVLILTSPGYSFRRGHRYYGRPAYYGVRGYYPGRGYPAYWPGARGYPYYQSGWGNRYHYGVSGSYGLHGDWSGQH